jgi:cation diffusion facilitator family transporter
MSASRSNIRFQAVVLAVSIGLMAMKFTAYFITGSNAIFTDALESIINVAAGSFALYSLILAAKPEDMDHPYGHGKVEFISSGLEGFLILTAGLFIIGKSGYAFFVPNKIENLGTGIVLVAISGGFNFAMGFSKSIIPKR